MGGQNSLCTTPVETNNLTGVTLSGIVFFNQSPFKQTASENWPNPLKNARKAMIWVISSRNTDGRYFHIVKNI